MPNYYDGVRVVNNPVTKARRQALVIVSSQVFATVLIALMCGFAVGISQALSVAVGGGVGVLATAYMAFSVLRHGLGTSMGRVMWGFVMGWAIKVLLTLALLVIAFRSPALKPAYVLAAYVVSFIVYGYAAVRSSR
jgi:F0F1-type ATP synthase assembly protein I